MRERLFAGDKELLTLMETLVLESTSKEEGRGESVKRKKTKKHRCCQGSAGRVLKEQSVVIGTKCYKEIKRKKVEERRDVLLTD